MEGDLLGLSFETAWHWSNLLDFLLVGNWMCAQVSTWIFPETNLRWTQAKQYGVIFGWEMSNGPILVICKGPSSEIPNECEIGALHGVCVGNFWSDPGSMMWWDVWLEDPMDPSSAMGSGFWLEMLNGPQLGEVEGNFVGDYGGKVLG